jgi:hypothetical protein
MIPVLDCFEKRYSSFTKSDRFKDCGCFRHTFNYLRVMNEGNSRILEPFDIDDHSLSGLSLEQAFTLGVEWQMFRQKLHSGKPFTTFCLPANTNRLVKMAERHKRFVEDRPNVPPGWCQIHVGDCIL